MRHLRQHHGGDDEQQKQRVAAVSRKVTERIDKFAQHKFF
jgi:hypothetical protein